MKSDLRVSMLERELGEVKEALAFQRALMTDLLIEIGTRETCARCGRPTIWTWKRNGNGLLLNIDGTQHWPACQGTPRPGAATSA